MTVTDAGFFNLTRKLVALSEELCGGRLVLTLEGGYGLQGLAYGVVATLAALLGSTRRLPIRSGRPRVPSVPSTRSIWFNCAPCMGCKRSPFIFAPPLASRCDLC